MTRGFGWPLPGRADRDEFDFGYREDFPRHIEAFQPTFCKVLERCNPEGNEALDGRDNQADSSDCPIICNSKSRELRAEQATARS